MKKHLLFLGAPGAGKGTQAELLSQTNSYLHLSTGELLRKEIEMNTTLGIEVKDIMNRGELVSDELVLKIVRQNLDKDNNGWILDGYPRNLSQVKTLEKILSDNEQKIDLVLKLSVSLETIKKRILERQILEKRADDNEATAVKRYKTYEESTTFNHFIRTSTCLGSA